MEKMMLGRSFWLVGTILCLGTSISHARSVCRISESEIQSIVADLHSSDRIVVSRGNSAVEVLLKRSVQTHVPSACLKALVSVAKTLDTVPPAVVATMNGNDFHMRARAIEFISYMGPSAKSAVPLIVKILNDPKMSVIRDYDLRGVAISALGSIGPAAKDGVPTMVKLFEDSSINRRITAISIGSIGPGAKAAEPALKAALDDDDQELRMFSARALKNIGTPDALEAVKAYTGKGGKI